MKEELFKQCVGIDISKLKFTACLCKYYTNEKSQFSSIEEFDNTKTGFNQFIKWSRKNLIKDHPCIFLMEATGIYYESLAYHLHKIGLSVVVVLGNKARHYLEYLGLKTKNDRVDAHALALMGSLQKLSLWTPPCPLYRELRALTRLSRQLIKERSRILNNLEAIENSQSPLPCIVTTLKHLIKSIDKAIEKNEKEIKKLVDSDQELSQRIKKIETIKGVRFATIVSIIAETQGFSLITSRKQLASYAGLDVIERQSGTSVWGKTKISKKGNSHIRAAMYFPALTASRFNPSLKEDYQRIIQRNPQAKKIGVTALQRKLLLLIYTLWKNGQEYKPKQGVQE